MGGPKKPTLSQLEKRLAKQRQQQQERQAAEKTVGSIVEPSVEELVEFAKTQRYLTPYVLSEKFGIRLSVAKRALSRLAEMKVVRLVAGDSRLRIYAPVELKVEEKREEKPGKKRKKEKKG